MSDHRAVSPFRRTGFERVVRVRHLVGGFGDCGLDAVVAVLEIRGERILSVEGRGAEQSSHQSQGPDAIHGVSLDNWISCRSIPQGAPNARKRELRVSALFLGRR